MAIGLWSKRNISVTAVVVFILTVSYREFASLSRPSNSNSAIEWWKPVPLENAIDPNPHQKYRTADDFLPHFDAVLLLPPLTIQDAKKTCTWSETELSKIDFTFGPGQLGPATEGWIFKDRDQKEIDKHRQEWQDYIKNNLIPYSTVKDRFMGRGIVILAGNDDTLKRTEVLLRALKYHGCTLPVEIHYWKDEMDEGKKEKLVAVYGNMFFNDLSTPDNLFKSTPIILRNYQFKTAALFNSRFAEPLLLDSDNIPNINPEELWASRTYKEFGSVFWPDIARTYPQDPIWSITNTPCRMDEYEQESGQLLVDKRQYFYHLQLATWLNNKTDYYLDFLLGDKDLFRFAWHALKTPYGRPSSWLTSVGLMQDDGLYCGHSFGQHHPDEEGEIAFLHGGLLKTFSTEAIEHWREEGGLFKHVKRSPNPANWREITRVGIQFRGGDHIKGLEGMKWDCTDMFDIEPEKAQERELLDGFEDVFEKIHGYWLVDKV